MDAALLLQLVDLIEEKVVENLALLSVLKYIMKQTPSVKVEQLLGAARNDPKLLESVRLLFAPLRDELASEHNLEQALQEFLAGCGKIG